LHSRATRSDELARTFGWIRVHPQQPAPTMPAGALAPMRARTQTSGTARTRPKGPLIGPVFEDKGLESAHDYAGLPARKEVTGGPPAPVSGDRQVDSQPSRPRRR